MRNRARLLSGTAAFSVEIEALIAKNAVNKGFLGVAHQLL
jgi:hypothetical protein